MRIVTWNLWWRFGPWEARQPAISTVLSEIGPDIACLQEVWSEEGGHDQVAGLAADLGMHHVRTPERFHNGVSFGNGILSRWPVIDVDIHRLPPVDGPGHRQAVAARIDAPVGQVVVICTHLDHRFDHSARRQEQVRALLSIVARHHDPEGFPVILAGDLNAIPSSDEIRLMTGETEPPVPGLVMSDSWAHAGDGPGHTWDRANPHVTETAWPRRRLDYVMVSWPRPRPLGNVSSARLAGIDPVGGVTPSDHYAVVVDLVSTAPLP